MLFVSTLRKPCTHELSCLIAEVESRLPLADSSVERSRAVMTRILCNFVAVNYEKLETRDKFVAISLFHAKCV